MREYNAAKTTTLASWFESPGLTIGRLFHGEQIWLLQYDRWTPRPDNVLAPSSLCSRIPLAPRTEKLHRTERISDGSENMQRSF
jgi:hypothetical protein